MRCLGHDTSRLILSQIIARRTINSYIQVYKGSQLPFGKFIKFFLFQLFNHQSGNKVNSLVFFKFYFILTLFPLNKTLYLIYTV